MTLARLGSHAEGVHICIKDAGRRMLIEARDFDGGPVLASSTVSLERWTGMNHVNVDMYFDECDMVWRQPTAQMRW